MSEVIENKPVKVPSLGINSYDWEKRIEIVKVYLMTGSRQKTCEVCNIHIGTLDKYRGEDWWPEVVAEIKKQRDSRINTKLSTIVERALEVVEDRLEHGDLVLNNKTGELIRKPVPLREASKAANELLARQQQIEKQDSESTVQKETVQATLGMLAAEFAKWSKATGKANSQEIEFTMKSESNQEISSNAIHDKWEEGLQERKREVQQSPGSDQKEGSS